MPTATFTPTPTAPGFPPATWTRTGSRTPTRTPSRTRTPTRSRTATRTSTSTRTPTRTRTTTRSRTATRTSTHTRTPTRTLPPSPTATRTETGFNFEPIPDQTIDLGAQLVIQLHATAPAGQTVTFSVAPLPLPVNAMLDASTGAFTFRPAEDQVGIYDLTFTANNGSLTASQPARIIVRAAPPDGTTALRGRVLDTNAAIVGDEIPVVGVTVSLLETGVSTTTDAQGRFLLRGVPSGHQVLDFNTSTAAPAPDGSGYANFRRAIELIAGVTTVIDRPFYLPRIATESLTTVDPQQTTVVVNPTLNIEMDVQAHTAKAADGSDFTGQLSISEVPEGLTPGVMPKEFGPGLLITVQPVGVTFAQPVPIAFPNIDNLPPGTVVDLWSLNPDRGRFEVVGKAQVSSDGQRVETIEGGVRAADWHFILPPKVAGSGQSNNFDAQENPNIEQLVCTGSETSVGCGNLTIHHSTAPYASLGASRSLQLTYNSLRADPQVIVGSDFAIARRAAVPDLLSLKLEVGGVEQGQETFIDTSGVSRNTGLRTAFLFDASALPTGLYSHVPGHRAQE